jgi:ATP-dependent DNA helicase PIF1
MDTLKTVEDLLHLSPIKFQEMTMSLYKALGCEVHPVRIPGRHHLYVDILTKDSKKSLAECRIGLEDVDKDAVESFTALLKKEKAVEGAIITFGEVTEKARQMGKKKRIFLYDGNDFLSLWNNLHLSDTTPSEPEQRQVSAFTEEPSVLHEVKAQPAWIEQKQVEADTGSTEGSFLGQIQAENQKDLKAGRTRDEIHRLFDSKPPVDAPPEVVEPVAEKPAVGIPALNEELPAGQKIDTGVTPPAETSVPFVDYPQIEPEAELLPESLPTEAEPLPVPESVEPQSLESEEIRPDEMVPSGQSDLDLVENYFKLGEEAQPSESEPLPSADKSVDNELPMPAKESEVQGENENENVIQRLFGHGVESDSSNKTPSAPVEDEMVDFSIFQVPDLKPKDTSVNEPLTPDQPIPESSPLPESPVAGSMPAQAATEAQPVLEPTPTEEQPVFEFQPTQAPADKEPVPASDLNSEQPPVEVEPAQAPIEAALVETAPLDPESARLVFKNFGLEEYISPPAADQETVNEALPPEVEPEAAPTDGQFLDGFFALSEDSSAPEAPVQDSVSPEKPAEIGLQEPAVGLPSEEPPAPVELPETTEEKIAEISPVAEEIQPVEPPASTEGPTGLPELTQVVEAPAEAVPAVQEPLIVVLHPDQAASSHPKGPDPDNPFLSKAAERMQSDSPCIFITGRTGTGKNILVDDFVQSGNKNVVLLAPTALGALEFGGQTLRSFFNFQEYPVQVNDVQEISDPTQKEIYGHIDSLIIDEISKVGPNVIDAIDRFMRLNGREPEKAFGGVQVIFFGDLFQASYNKSGNGMAGIPTGEYRSPFFFDANVFKLLPLEVIELQKEYDCRDEAMVALLNAIRTNALDEAQYKALAERVDPDFKLPAEPAYITLTSNSGVATRINREHLKQLRSPECLHVAEIEGEFEEGAYPVDRDLVLRRGAQVVFLKEDYAKKWVKGTIGKVTNISESTIQVEIDSDGFPFVFRVERETWQNYRYKFNPASGKIEKEVVGEFTQYPLCPGWAMTVQKSQGSRFEYVAIDLSGEEAEYGQLYPALCSCRKLEGVVLKDRISQKYKANAVNRIQEIASLF